MAMTKEKLDPPQSVVSFSEKNYRPSAVEQDLYKWWEDNGFFTPDEGNPGKPFVLMLPLPNVTGDLHLGHALGFGGYEDLMARWHRMLGEPTLYMPGTDHAGIIAQKVVEDELAKNEIGRNDLGREKFLAEMWKWMDHYRPRIEKQLRLLGCSLDWSRRNFTMEPSKQRAVRTHFIRLFKRGHLYRADRIVHWCVRCQTTYSDLELEHVQRTDPLYFVRYPWADPKPGDPALIIATTRPETIVADVAVAVHPDDARWKPFVGRDVLVPMIERRVKVIADEAVDPAFGTGALKITPGHDATDFEIGQGHGLPVISVIDKRGYMTPAAGPLAGPDRDTGRKMAVEMLKDRGLLVREEPLTHAVGVHDRCKTVDEPLVMKQWWAKMPPLAAPAIAAVRDGRVTIHPRYQEKVYFNWMENIRDWPVSRQIWWGHSIPVWYCGNCDEIVVPDEDGPDPTRCTRCRSDDIQQDPDVLDTWFSSALWPFSTLGWPDQTSDLGRYYPGSVLETGYDILFFWVARMIMMGIEEMGDIPFHTVYLHGLVLVDGEKMSKSTGNVISPVGFIEQYGADALRFALVNGVAAGADQTLSEAKLQNAKEFANKLWNIGRFVLHHVDANADALREWRADRTPAPKAGAGSADPSLGHAERWILSRTEATVAELTRLLEHYLFGEYASALQQFVWSEFADVYLELAKAGLRDEKRAAGTVRTLAYVLDRILRLAHPIVPFISDTVALQLWQKLPNTDRSPSLVIAKWPTPGTRSVALEERMEIALELVRAIRNLRQEAGTKPGERVKTTLGGDTTAIHDLADLISHLAQTEVTFGTGGGQAAVVRAIDVRVAVERDPAEYRARLERELADAKETLRRSRDLLARPGFAEKAPANVVANEKARLAEREERVRLLEEELRRAA
ncbi:MAG TPA: valine--tRNA ligase [Candidatus Limnocylindria bacterium]|nr:valine--tRNA ligase [Candidatus Limnocylindria bacterium]